MVSTQHGLDLLGAMLLNVGALHAEEAQLQLINRHVALSKNTRTKEGKIDANWKVWHRNTVITSRNTRIQNLKPNTEHAGLLLFGSAVFSH